MNVGTLALSGRKRGKLLRGGFDGVRLWCERKIIVASGVFQPHWYVETYPDVRESSIDPLAHYLRWGAGEGRYPCAMFDTEHYLSQYPGLDPDTTNPLCHYLLVGEREGARPNIYFEPDYFLAQEGQAKATNFSALKRYWMLSDPGEIDPSPAFSSSVYLRCNPDVREAGLNPLHHYLSSGFRDPWRMPSEVQPAEMQSAASPEHILKRPAAYRVERVCSVAADDDILIFVAFCADGRLSSLQRRQIGDYQSAGYRVVLCINSPRFEDELDPDIAAADAIIVRENAGFDFGAWAHVCRVMGGLDRARSVTFTNDSVVAVGGNGALASQREAINEAGRDILFATQNLEIREHFQSYFFSVSRAALERGALQVIAGLPTYSDKDALIQEVEITLGDRFADNGFECGHLYALEAAEHSGANPTIHHWKEAIDAGMPYFKVQLLSAGIVSGDDPELLTYLGPALTADLGEHVAIRGAPVEARRLNKEEDRTFPHLEKLFNEYGAQMAANPAPSEARPMLVPFSVSGSSKAPSVLAVVHCFYVDIAEQILDEVASLEFDFRVLLTTDTEEKAAQLGDLLDERNLRGKAVVVPNRGRDVAPFLVECGRDGGDEDVILHLHTKKSPHDCRYAGWGEFLRDNLIGSRAIVESVFALFANPKVGLVCSEHFPEVAGLRNWGFDFEKARTLLGRLGIVIDAGMLLDFPTSTMFWIRRAALQPLLELGLTYDDFDPEEGQIDGTLAHAIERCFFYLAEAKGFRHVKVISEKHKLSSSVRPRDVKAEDLEHVFKAPSLKLLGSQTSRRSFSSRVGEVYPVDVAGSSETRPRFNILVPTLKPEKVYGGITTALQTAEAIAAALGDGVDLRILVTSDDVNAPSLGEISRRMERAVVLVEPKNDVCGGATVVDLTSNRAEPVSLRSNDLFFATAWWTADLAFRLKQNQAGLFGASAPVIYLIQDFEPGFYAWSDHYSLAEATYRQFGTIAIINSEELANFMAGRYEFEDVSCIPFKLNKRLDETLTPAAKEPVIICYGRPSTARNCFALLVEGLRQWQWRQPDVNTKYRVVFAGEPFEPSLVSEIENAEVAGKLSLDDYAGLLSRAAVGVSLMVSPHPSYPPLEMATAGCITITNQYDSKDLSVRADNIISLSPLDPTRIADALDLAVSRARIGEAVPRAVIRSVASDVSGFDPLRVAKLVSDWRRR